jgi:hypothetical protein
VVAFEPLTPGAQEPKNVGDRVYQTGSTLNALTRSRHHQIKGANEGRELACRMWLNKLVQDQWAEKIERAITWRYGEPSAGALRAIGQRAATVSNFTWPASNPDEVGLCPGGPLVLSPRRTW